MTWPGPAALGRGVIVNADGPIPAAWKDAPIIEVRDGSCVPGLHEAWLRRSPIVVRLLIDPATFREPMSYGVEPWKVDPAFDPTYDRLHFLIWANNYDARAGDPIWWWSQKAERLGAPKAASGHGDVVVDGEELWIDGGPREPLALPHIHAETIDLQRLTIARQPVDAHPTILLAPDQMAAVSHQVGPARIIAPAGSGKTRVLTERLRHLLVQRGVESELVAAVAYNKNAQQELAERCAAFRPRVVTLNALGHELLGRPPVLDERELRRIVERLVPAQRRRANVDPIGPYLEALSRVRMGLLDPAEVEDERDDVPGLAEAFDPFREELKRQGAVDFDEQIYASVERLLVDGKFRRATQKMYRHMLVDEFQDLTPCHVLMIRLIASPELDVFGVGDDDQVIYGHTGADPKFLVCFDDYFPGAASHPLTVNYRCPVRVVNAARQLLSYNALRVEKAILPGPDAGRSSDALTIRRHAIDRGGRELVDVVQAWISDGVAPSEIAVLTRVNSLLLAPQVALATAGVPMVTTLDSRVLDRTGSRAALAYLRIATAGEGFARNDLMEVLRRPSRGLPVWIDKWFRNATMKVGDLRSISRRLDDAKVEAKLLALADDLALVTNAASRSSTRELLRIVKDRIGLGQAMGLLDASSANSSHLDDLEALEQVADLHPDPAGFEPWLRAVLAQPSDPQGITLATIHRVKGREWPCVAVFGCSDGILPHRLSQDLEEERRIMHVGITRGHSNVVVFADAARPSRFLQELDGSATREPKRAAIKPSPEPAKATQTRQPAEGTAVDPELVERLRTWRSQRAKADGVPPYVIFHDRHLQAIAAAKPQTLRALAAVDGMGPRRLEFYADELLALIAE